MRPDDDFPWLRITAFSSLRCFDAVGSVTDGHLACIKVKTNYPRRSSFGTVGGSEPTRQLADPVSPEK